MSHPLDDCFMKLDRADVHLKTAEETIQRLISPEPDLIPAELDPDTGEHFFPAQRDSPDTRFISPIVGDFVHNVRAALDYLTCRLVEQAGGIVTNRTYFPIFTNPEVYTDRAPTAIKGTPRDARTVFEALQPFSGPNSNPFDPRWRDPEGEPLAVLHELDRIDKHRALSLTEAVGEVEIKGLPDHIALGPTPHGWVIGPFKRNAPISVIRFQRPPGEQVNVYLSVRFHIVFDPDGPAATEDVIKTLDDIRQTVRHGVVPAFERFFPPR